MSAVKSDAASRKKSKDRNVSKPAPAIEQADGIGFNAQPILFGLLLFLSGTAALIYQILWIKQLSLIVGVEVYSITVAVSAFFAGLALGGAVFGRFTDRFSKPLVLYAILEGGIAALGIFSTISLAHSAGLFVTIEARAGLLAWVLPFILVGAPAFLMGGTLPVAVRSQVYGFVQIARTGGWIYAANTAGGIAGVLLSSFALLPWLGVRNTALAAALLNLGAAGMAMALVRRAVSDLTETEVKEAEAVDSPSDNSGIALVLYAISGGIALGYEVVWSQAMAQFLSTRVFAFSVVLATYLAGLVVGSALYARFSHKVRDPWGVFGLLIAAAAVVALFEIAGLDLWQLRFQIEAGNVAFAATGSEFARMGTHFAVAATGIVFVPTVMLGAAFPAVLRLAARETRAGMDVGIVLALNTAGGIAGTLLTGFLLVPILGLVRTLSILAILATTVGVLAVLLGSAVSRKMQLAVCVLGVIAIIGGILAPQDRLARLLLTTRGGGNLIFYQESRGATVAVAEQRSGDNVFRRLYIQGVSNSGDAMPSLRYMRLQAMLPLIIHRGEPRSALVIGFGTGITAGAVLHYPQLYRRVCVELLPAVVRAGELFPENYKAGSDPGMQIRLRDGRQELLHSSERYDLITLEPPPPSAEGVVNLYSTDFYKLASRRLERNGLFAQWLPLATQNDEDTRSLVRSFLDVFPYATLWTTEMHEMLLVGSYSPIDLDVHQITSRFMQSSVSTPLKAVGISSPAALLATWVTGRDGLERYAARANPVTDDHPRIEYAAWVRPREISRVLPELLALRTDPPLVNADDNLRPEIDRQRQVLLNFYAAGLAAYNGDREKWRQTIQEVLAIDGNNPYYAWVTGERK
ncbi:putative membrane-bound spermidine synthase [Edaphobacter aggregans]|uniref:Putative membrane-bound spermidine synthase n=1 Tax=Edaphobacter aggregans TaxID=570835 RepID=A0A428MCI6_9BACT|nr:fused MFS/spermidine synthase [Edaphobacter aggregans]RSL14608.1 putative membrane-bound spermidine synthase [Edaphobacter aggregans]